MKNILCYGDSNLWAQDSSSGERIDKNERWTGILQNHLGSDYYVIEEGLRGRTSSFNDPLRDDANGRTFLPMILRSHQPLDLVIIALGTNDSKNFFGLNSDMIAKGIKAVADTVKSFPFKVGSKPRILVVSPTSLGDNIENGLDPYAFDKDSVIKIEKLPSSLKRELDGSGIDFLDASSVKPGIDQIHLDRKGHKSLASLIIRKLEEMDF